MSWAMAPIMSRRSSNLAVECLSLAKRRSANPCGSFTSATGANAPGCAPPRPVPLRTALAARSSLRCFLPGRPVRELPASLRASARDRTRSRRTSAGSCEAAASSSSSSLGSSSSSRYLPRRKRRATATMWPDGWKAAVAITLTVFSSSQTRRLWSSTMTSSECRAAVWLASATIVYMKFWRARLSCWFLRFTLTFLMSPTMCSCKYCRRARSLQRKSLKRRESTATGSARSRFRRSTRACTRAMRTAGARTSPWASIKEMSSPARPRTSSRAG
mmetsp:Transcript_7620/g.25944  ORF Transcript_7620/g.25944 Transcript_7620/m.25944 type:complete len:274 (+) Transcript_7620:486-1307(+)